MRLNLNVSVRKVIGLLVLVAFTLAALSLAGQLYRIFLGPASLFGVLTLNPQLFGFVQLLDVGQDQSIPAWYSAFLLFFCSVLLFVISVAVKNAGGRYVNHWRVLALVFLYLSADEGASIHEKVGHVVRGVFVTLGAAAGNAIPAAWVIPYAVLALVFVLAYLRFFFHLPAKQKVLFFVAGAVYVGAAMGLEVFRAFYISFFDSPREMTSVQQVVNILIITTEELLEMVGVIVFVYALLSFVRSRVDEIGIRLGKPTGSRTGK